MRRVQGPWLRRRRGLGMLESLWGMRQRSRLRRRGAKTLLRAWRWSMQGRAWPHAQRVLRGLAMRGGAVIIMPGFHLCPYLIGSSDFRAGFTWERRGSCSLLAVQDSEQSKSPAIVIIF